MDEEETRRAEERCTPFVTRFAPSSAMSSYRLAGDGNVTTLEIDPTVAAQASKNLDAAGVHPLMVG
jgi:hypothetical protein